METRAKQDLSPLMRKFKRKKKDHTCSVIFVLLVPLGASSLVKLFDAY